EGCGAEVLLRRRNLLRGQNADQEGVGIYERVVDGHEGGFDECTHSGVLSWLRRRTRCPPIQLFGADRCADGSEFLPLTSRSDAAVPVERNAAFVRMIDDLLRISVRRAVRKAVHTNTFDASEFGYP